MRIPTTRHALAPSRTKGRARRGLLTCLAAAALAAVLLPSPAQATTIVCETLLRSTPTVHADLDGDGYPEYRVPAITNVTLCSDASASYVTYSPRTENCSAGWHPTCMAVYVTYMPADAQAGARGELCFTLEGSRLPSCRVIQTPPLPQPVHQTACIGYDLNGGHPCSGETLALTVQ